MLIRNLSPGLLEDWCDFFDTRAFSDYPDWGGCYCMHFHRPRRLPPRSSAAGHVAISPACDTRFCAGAARPTGPGDAVRVAREPLGPVRRIARPRHYRSSFRYTIRCGRSASAPSWARRHSMYSVKLPSYQIASLLPSKARI